MSAADAVDAGGVGAARVVAGAAVPAVSHDVDDLVGETACELVSFKVGVLRAGDLRVWLGNKVGLEVEIGFEVLLTVTVVLVEFGVILAEVVAFVAKDDEYCGGVTVELTVFELIDTVLKPTLLGPTPLDDVTGQLFGSKVKE